MKIPSSLLRAASCAALCLAVASRLLGLDAPTLTKPAVNSSGLMPHPGFYWNAVAGAETYRIEIARDAAFTDLAVSRDGLVVPRFVPLVALPARAYHWRVTAVAGATTATSAAFPYTVGTPANTVYIESTDSLATIRNRLVSAAATPGSVVNFPLGGNFDFDVYSDTASFLFTLSGATDLVINGNGSRILIRNKLHMGFLKITDSTRVTVRDLVVDYDPLPHSLVRVVVNNSTASTLDLDVELMPVAGQGSAYYPELTNNAAFTDHWSWACLLDKNNRGRLKPGAPSAFGIGVSDATRTNGSAIPARYRLHHPGSSSGVYFAPGDLVAILCRTGVGSFASATKVNDMTFAGITSYASPMGNYYSFDGSDLKVLDCHSSLLDSTRYLSANADGVHCRANPIGPWVESCSFVGNGDDGVALYNKGVVVLAKDSTTRLQVKKGELMNLVAGDVFRIFYPQEGRFLGAHHTVSSVSIGATSATIVFTPAIADADYALIAAQSADDQSAQLFNASRRNDRFVVTGNTFTVRGRGAIVRSANGVIEDNLFAGCSAPAIALYNEAAQWFNGASSRDVAIVGNDIRHCGFDTLGKGVGSITVLFNEIEPAGAKMVDVLAPATSKVHENIAIFGNTITDFPQHGIWLSHAANSLVRENRFVSTTSGYTHAGDHYAIVARATYGTEISANELDRDTRARTANEYFADNTALVHAPGPLDNAASSGVVVTGAWSSGTGGIGAYYGSNYVYTGASATKSVLFTPALTQTRPYLVQIRWTAHANRASNAPVDILHSGGTATTSVNQRVNGGDWITLGTYTMAPASGHGVKIRATGADGYVVADAVRLVPAP